MGATALALPSTAATAAPEPFVAGTPYSGDFPDPSVLQVGTTYVVASTTTAYLNLPVMTSTDLTTWIPRAVRPDAAEWSDDPTYNDAMAQPPYWAAPRGSAIDRRALVSQWAPSLAQVGDHYLAAYSAAVTLEPRSSCIGIAWSTDPTGPYTTTSPDPLVCFSKSPYGAIDPEIFVDDGTPYLLWKNERGRAGSPQAILVRKLSRNGLRFAPGSTAQVLLRPSLGWEGNVVENPSMVRYRGRYLLLYSGNSWHTELYATGYAVCDSPLGPCRKPKSGRPLLASSVDQLGPGGADAFVDGARLRFVFHAYDPGFAGEGQPRRLHVGRLGIAGSGRVWVVKR
jgi:beta-xylosidase